MSLRDIKDGWYNLVKTMFGGEVPEWIEDIAQERYDICLECPHLKTLKGWNVKHCTQCSCGFPALVWAPQKKCPLNKWKR